MKRSLIGRILAKLSLKWRLLIALPLAGGLVLCVALATMMVYYTVVFPHPLAISKKEHAPVIRILARDGSVLAERGTAGDYMPLDLLPKHVWGAVVATEDRRFFSHYGLDPLGLIRACFVNLRAGRVVQGGSTLTQQLAKNLFLTPDRTLSRKFEELGLALWLELRLSKADILELYLNRVYFGGGAYGIEAASQRYFDKSARELSVAEAALIAGLLKAPSRYSPASSPEVARARSRVVLGKMVEAGVISEAQERKALDERLTFFEPRAQRETSEFGYVIDFVLERMPPLADGADGEVVVETTIDANLQRRANAIVASVLEKDGAALGASQAAVVVLDTDGGIRTLVGGRNYAQSQFNRAVKARRQPGSSFKPFVYLAALEAGMTPETPAYDLPVSINGYAPRNDNGTYAGEVTLRRALAQSINTVAVRLNQIVGRGRTVEVAHRLGIGSALRDDASLALGTSEVSLIDMTAAYDVLANGGERVVPHAIRSVRMSSGRVLYVQDVPRADPVVDPLIVGSMNDMLNAALLYGTGRRAGLAEYPAAGKTGTTQDFRDAWFVGYTSHLAGGVWMGNDSSAPMRRAVGGGLPAEIWRQIMTYAHSGREPVPLPGTRVAPESAAAQVATLSWATRKARAHVPRVDRIIETLPWLRRAASTEANATPMPVRTTNRPATPVASSEGDRKRNIDPAQPVHPAERIQEAFIDKVLADSAAADGSRVAADAQPTRPRPKGMMSLGGWW
jgi:penicillin-binding protein 1A